MARRVVNLGWAGTMILIVRGVCPDGRTTVNWYICSTETSAYRPIELRNTPFPCCCPSPTKCSSFEMTSTADPTEKVSHTPHNMDSRVPFPSPSDAMLQRQTRARIKKGTENLPLVFRIYVWIGLNPYVRNASGKCSKFFRPQEISRWLKVRCHVIYQFSWTPTCSEWGDPRLSNSACAKTEVENDQTNVKTDEVTIGAMDVALVTTQLPKRVR